MSIIHSFAEISITDRYLYYPLCYNPVQLHYSYSHCWNGLSLGCWQLLYLAPWTSFSASHHYKFWGSPLIFGTRRCSRILFFPFKDSFLIPYSTKCPRLIFPDFFVWCILIPFMWLNQGLNRMYACYYRGIVASKPCQQTQEEFMCLQRSSSTHELTSPVQV